MADHQFEQKVSQQLADFKLKPNAEVWQQVQLQLEEDRKRRRWFFYLPIAALLIGGLLYAVWPVEETVKADTVAQATTNNRTTTTAENNTNESSLTKAGSSKTLTEATASEKEVEENKLQAQTKTSASAQQNSVVTKQVAQKIKTVNRQSVAGTTEKQTSKDEVVVSDKVSVQKETAADQTIVTVESKQPEQKTDSVVVDQSAAIKTDAAQPIVSTTADDTIAVAPAVPTPTITKRKWQLGLHVSSGLSDIRGSLFPGSGFKSFSSSDALYYSGGNNAGQGGPTRIIRYEYAVTPSIHFGAGVLFRKPLKKRHAFVTGLQYQYSSYSVTQRQRIDSFMTLTNMFSNISTKEKSVQFRMHAVNVPLELEFKIADIKKGRLLFSAGIHNWFVVSSTQTDTLSAFRYAASTDRSIGYGGIANAKETKATTYQPQLYLSPSFEWHGKKTNSQLGLYLDYGLRPAYKSTVKDYWWQTGIRYRIFFNR
ncbi:outer membrane beta-barrel protein [Lacibacter sediminis]|uniref:Outer membrane beta-barrel protein n=1 Tax=Lacibacter sediminis TaxID=2760713 RepID=A0A7G5XKT4_9BACT|nr:outer membrane beta-barrel protein [Lacibacter sediminis]QNA46087.1 outer membrane beta-barrel protein [Lacibacter sediminis]